MLEFPYLTRRVGRPARIQRVALPAAPLPTDLPPVVVLVALRIELSRFRWRLESEAQAQETVALARMRVARPLRLRFRLPAGERRAVTVGAPRLTVEYR